MCEKSAMAMSPTHSWSCLFVTSYALRRTTYIITTDSERHACRASDHDVLQSSPGGGVAGTSLVDAVVGGGPLGGGLAGPTACRRRNKCHKA